MADLLSAGARYGIASQTLFARFCPDMGGRLLEFGWRNGPPILVAMAPQDFEATNWPRAGAYPLIPYHNRLAGAAITVGDESVRLRSHPAALPHTLHGPGHIRPWQAGAHDDCHFSMSLDYRADEDWPWDFRAEQRFEISEIGLCLTLSVENRSDRAMPAGMGWHPYFVSRDTIVTDARRIWPHRSDYLPDGGSVAVPPGDGEVKALTAYLEGWSKAEIMLADGYSACLTASSPFGFLVVHRGDPAHICVEPVTHVANAWNLALPPPETGAILLPPGGRMTGSIDIHVRG